ncbi:MAG: alpha/beta hydrolase [Steroidobacteraceae bacterium]|jgi:pimeloyl-ACP methyl ester carboxylesterase
MTSPADNRAQRRNGYAPGPFGQVHFQIWGEGVPLMLCHQSPSSSEQFTAIYPLLARRKIQAIGIDTPGFGMSTAPDHPPSIEEYADCVTAVLDHLGLPRAHILGQHTGSMVAMEATLRHPGRFASLILNTPTPFSAEERIEWSQRLTPRQRAWRPQADGSHLTALWQRRCAASGSWTHLPAMHREVVQMLRAGDTLWYGHAASFRYDQLGRLASISLPTLILTNSGDLTFPLAKRAAASRPDFDYVELAGGTHDIVDEQPEAFSAAVATFIGRQVAAGRRT